MSQPIRLTVIFATALFVMGPRPASALQIVAPVAGITLAPGASVTVRVVPEAGEQIATVAIGIGTESVDGTVLASPAGAFEATVIVPKPAVGPNFIVAVATLVGGGIAFDFIDVLVEPGPLRSLILSSIPTMGRVGQVVQLFVKGVFEDGVIRTLTLPETGTTYSTSNDTVLGMHASGLIQARRKGFAEIRVTNRGKTTSAEVGVAVPDPPDNGIPVPDPGADQIVAPKTLVTLSAAGSHDPDGDALQYHWQQEGGRIVTLRGSESAQTIFTAPRVDAEEVLTFSLVVGDTKGAKSFPATVNITVRP